METTPIYKSVPTLRDYEDYKAAAQYTQGWNDAMHFIFDIPEEKLKKLHEQKKQELLENCEIIEGEKK
jgi:putative sterol carrier protein